MRARRIAASKDPAARHFPIFSYEDYDFSFSQIHWPIGLKSTYPEELIRRIGAAIISLQMGNSAIDYTYERYLKDHPYAMDDGSRLDLRISREIKNRTHLLSALVSKVSKDERKKNGNFVCEWTFLRIPFSINFLLSCANRGAFFESAAIARMILEQIAWAIAVNDLDDVDIIQKTSATKSIGLLKEKFSSVGRLYGWLSVHTHWAYEGHVKALHFEDGVTSSLFATPKFKACSLALTTLILVLAIKSFCSTKRIEIEAMAHSPVTKKQPGILDGWDDELVPTLTELQSLPNLSSLSELTNEIATHYPENEDILSLAAVVTRECEEGLDHG